MSKINLEEILKNKEKFSNLFKQKIEEEKNREPEIFVILKEFKNEIKIMKQNNISKAKQLKFIKEVFGQSMSAGTYNVFLKKYGLENDEK